MKRKSGSKKSGKLDESSNGVDEADKNGDADGPQDKKRKSGKGRKTKKDKQEVGSDEDGDSSSINDTDPLAGSENEAEYEVEAILDDKTIKGVQHYLIRWKGYTEESDTWEPEHTLDCPDIIRDFKKKYGGKKKKDRKSEKLKKDADLPFDKDQDYEVDRIIDVYFHKNGQREFLVHWKGYTSSSNSWEPEENMDCKDLIRKFMLKVENARKFDNRELRVQRKQVQRLNIAMHEAGRRLSKRNRGKERVRYFDAE